MVGPSGAADRHRVGLALVVAATVACWFAWMGWDTSLDVDPVTGRETGPYERWQVVGAVVTLVLIGVVAARWLPLRTLWRAVPPAFTAAWSVNAIGLDDQGLWIIGAAMVLTGTAVGTLVVVGPARLLWSAEARRRLAAALHEGAEIYRHPQG